jgi:hypothetical protein
MGEWQRGPGLRDTCVARPDWDRCPTRQTHRRGYVLDGMAANSREATIRDRLLDNVGTAVTVTTGLAYVVGFLILRSTANRLNVSVHDFGLTFADYLMLTLWVVLFATYFACALMVGVTVAHAIVVRFHPLVSGVVLFAGLLAYRGLEEVQFPRGLLFFVAAFGVIVLLSTTISLPLAFVARAADLSPRRTYLVLAGGALVLVIVTFAWAVARTPETWATDVRFYAKGHERPFGLFSPSAVLDPQIGIAVWSGHRACAVRLGSRVLLSQDESLVVSDLELFQPTACEVVKTFRGLTTASRSSVARFRKPTSGRCCT